MNDDLVDKSYFETVFINYLGYADKQNKSIMTITDYDDLNKSAKFFQKLEKKINVEETIMWDPSLINIQKYSEKFDILNNLNLNYEEIYKIMAGNSFAIHMENGEFEDKIKEYIKKDNLIYLLSRPKMLNLSMSRFELPKKKWEAKKNAKQTFNGYVNYVAERLSKNQGGSEIYNNHLRKVILDNQDAIRGKI